VLLLALTTLYRLPGELFVVLPLWIIAQ